MVQFLSALLVQFLSALDKQIYVMDADGSNRTRLTINSSIYDREPDWSPDGTKIAFTSFRDENEEIYVMDADGSNQTRLTINSSIYDREPDWIAE